MTRSYYSLTRSASSAQFLFESYDDRHYVRRRRVLTPSSCATVRGRLNSRIPVVWTIGHSTRSIDELAQALTAHDIELVADVRRFPHSRRLPHLGGAALEPALAAVGIGYRWFPALGGRRRPQPDSVNSGWRVAAFRGYADYLSSEEFAESFMELLNLSSGMRLAMMCAEVLWWRCHRRLIADVMSSIGFEVIHIRDASNSERHRLAPPARIVRGRLSYDPAPHT
jgi:uncharacterized protein (DUF488 family)